MFLELWDILATNSDELNLRLTCAVLDQVSTHGCYPVCLSCANERAAMCSSDVRRAARHRVCLSCASVRGARERVCLSCAERCAYHVPA